VKMILSLVNAARLDGLRHELAAAGAPGYSILPVAEGSGRTGVHAGDRVHPGALAAVFIVEEDERAVELLNRLARWRDAAGDELTRFFLLPVERQA
jgi:nitrogen regulatory protein PII